MPRSIREALTGSSLFLVIDKPQTRLQRASAARDRLIFDRDLEHREPRGRVMEGRGHRPRVDRCGPPVPGISVSAEQNTLNRPAYAWHSLLKKSAELCLGADTMEV